VLRFDGTLGPMSDASDSGAVLLTHVPGYPTFEVHSWGCPLRNGRAATSVAISVRIANVTVEVLSGAAGGVRVDGSTARLPFHRAGVGVWSDNDGAVHISTERTNAAHETLQVTVWDLPLDSQLPAGLRMLNTRIVLPAARLELADAEGSCGGIPIVTDPPNPAACAAHPRCAHLVDDCCPTIDGWILDCCSKPPPPPSLPLRLPPGHSIDYSPSNLSACAAHPRCAGLQGDCCPTKDDAFLGCCDVLSPSPPLPPSPSQPPLPSNLCLAHPACSIVNEQYERPLADACCPTTDGVFLACCEPLPPPPPLPSNLCLAHPACSIVNDQWERPLADACCPTTDGVFLACCEQAVPSVFTPSLDALLASQCPEHATASPPPLPSASPPPAPLLVPPSDGAMLCESVALLEQAHAECNHLLRTSSALHEGCIRAVCATDGDDGDSGDVVASELRCSTTPAPTCAGPAELCAIDLSCANGGYGCNAGGAGQLCRFCGFFTPGNEPFLPCPDAGTWQHTLEVYVPQTCPSVCTSNPLERCFYDPTCETDGLGCDAGHRGRHCRFCGFEPFIWACPDSTAPSDAEVTEGARQELVAALPADLRNSTHVQVYIGSEGEGSLRVLARLLRIKTNDTEVDATAEDRIRSAIDSPTDVAPSRMQRRRIMSMSVEGSSVGAMGSAESGLATTRAPSLTSEASGRRLQLATRLDTRARSGYEVGNATRYAVQAVSLGASDSVLVRAVATSLRKDPTELMVRAPLSRSLLKTVPADAEPTATAPPGGSDGIDGTAPASDDDLSKGGVSSALVASLVVTVLLVGVAGAIGCLLIRRKVAASKSATSSSTRPQPQVPTPTFINTSFRAPSGVDLVTRLSMSLGRAPSVEAANLTAHDGAQADAGEEGTELTMTGRRGHRVSVDLLYDREATKPRPRPPPLPMGEESAPQLSLSV